MEEEGEEESREWVREWRVEGGEACKQGTHHTGWLACRAGKQESPPDRDQGHADVEGKLYADTLLPRLLPSTNTSHTTRLRSAPHVVKFDAVGCLTRRSFRGG